MKKRILKEFRIWDSKNSTILTHLSIIYVGTICMKLIQPAQAKGGSRQNKPSERLSDKVRDNVEFWQCTLHENEG